MADAAEVLGAVYGQLQTVANSTSQPSLLQTYLGIRDKVGHMQACLNSVALATSQSCPQSCAHIIAILAKLPSYAHHRVTASSARCVKPI